MVTKLQVQGIKNLGLSLHVKNLHLQGHGVLVGVGSFIHHIIIPTYTMFSSIVENIFFT
jgi:hypothetical protein